MVSVWLNILVAFVMTLAIYYFVVGHENFVDHMHEILVRIKDKWRRMSK